MRIDRSGIRAALGALALTLAVIPLAGRAESSAGRAPEGIWQGSVAGVRLIVNVGRASDGRLTGTMDSPDQGAMGLAIDTLDFAGDSLHFELRRLRASYAGRMNGEGSELSGNWSQSGFSLPLVLKRLEKAPEFRRSQDPIPPYPYDTLTVSYDNAKAGVKLAGTLTMPRGTGPHPCAVLITGSGPENRDEEIFNHRPFRVLADHLTRAGIAVLRVDDRGVGGSTGNSANATSDDFAGDVLAGIGFLKTRPEIDRKHIGLIGHSEGGLIAPIAAMRSQDVEFIVLMAGPGLPGDSILILQSAAMRRLMGSDEAYVAREGAAHRRIHMLIRAGDSTGVVRATRDLLEVQIESMSPEALKGIGDLDSLAVLASRQFLSPWMRYFVGFDPRPTLAKVRCPVLALNGSKDFQVPPRENLAAIDAALKAGGNRDHMVKELPGLNHMFQTAGTGAISEYAMIDETLAPAALEEMSRWILARTTARR